MLTEAARIMARTARCGTMRVARAVTPRPYVRQSLAIGRVQILCFHSVPDATRFRELVADLCRDHELIPYGEAVERIVCGRLDRPALAISFDDGLASQLAAARVVEEAGSRACFFVCTAALSAAADEAARFCQQNLRALESDLMNWGDAESLLARGHEVGCHTHAHADLAKLSGTRLRDEICGSAELLRRRLGRVDHFAWPWGRWQHVSREAIDLVFDAGMVSCASAERGCHRRGCPDRRALVLRRLVVEPAERPWDLRVELALSARAAWPRRQTARPTPLLCGQ